MKTPTRLLTALCLLTLLAACAVTPNPSLSNAAGSVQLAQGQDASVPDVAQGSRISGTVNLKGLGAAAGVEVKVYAAGSAPQMPHWTTRTDGAGRFDVSVPEGSYNVVVRQTGSNLAAARFGVQSGVVLDIDLVPTGRISGKVRLEPAGDPLGVDVFVPGTGLMAKAGADGSFVITDVPVGPYKVVAVRQGYALVWSDSLDVDAANQRVVPDLVLANKAMRTTIQGEVRGQMLQMRLQDICWIEVLPPASALPPEIPLSDVQVTAHHIDGTVATASTDASGRFAISDFPLGVVAYRFSRPGYFDRWQDAVLAPRPEGATGHYETSELTTKTVAIWGIMRPLGVGESRQLGLSYVNDRAGPIRSMDDFVWHSSDDSVLTVNKGKVTAVGTGSAVIFAEDPTDATRAASISLDILAVRPDTLTVTAVGPPTEGSDGLTIGWSRSGMGVAGRPSEGRVVSRADGTVVLPDLCPGGYRFHWDASENALGHPWLQWYESGQRQVGPGALAASAEPIRLSWNWPVSPLPATPPVVFVGSTFSVAFNPYAGATEYGLEILNGEGLVGARAVGTASPLVVTIPDLLGGARYRLSFKQIPTSEAQTGAGFAGHSVSYPLEFIRAFAVGSTLTGRWLVRGKPLQDGLVQFKVPAQSWSSVTTRTDSSGRFSFQDIPVGQTVQLIWDDGNAAASTADDLSTLGLLVSEPTLAVANPDMFIPMIQADLGWELKPSPSINEITDGRFRFSLLPDADLSYQLAIFDTNMAAKLNVAADLGQVDLSADETYRSLASGNYLYQVKFYRKGGTFGGSNLFGASRYVPFKKQ